MAGTNLSHELLLRAARRILRPLVRLWMRGGVTFPVISAMLRELYVDVAQNDVLIDPRRRTDSRIAVLSGVHRKELRRLRELPSDEPTPPTKLALGSLLVARWLSVQPWAEAPGTPRRLPRVAPEGLPSFETLIGSATRDIRPRAVLDEWLAAGIVELDPADMVVLRDAAYLPQPGREEQFFYFARNLHDHAAAAAANVQSASQPQFLDRSVHYDRLPAAVATALESEARAAAVRLLIEINTRALHLLEQHAARSDGTRRVNLGIYLFSEDEAPRPTP